jgi:hypothetical protein
VGPGKENSVGGVMADGFEVDAEITGEVELEIVVMGAPAGVGWGASE